MHYYKRNIGDYAKKAGRLSLLQHGVYCQLIDACYDREAFPTLEEAIEWVWASTPEEEAAVQFVLRRFFTLEGDKYVQNEIREDIAAYHERATINKRIANERKQSVNESSTNRERTEGVVERNHKPLTINQEPSKAPVAQLKGSRLTKDWQLPAEWEEWCRNERPDLNPRLTAETFRDHWISKTGKDATKLDWEATWRNWVRGARRVPGAAFQPAATNIFAGGR